jgi:hypothetical protein
MADFSTDGIERSGVDLPGVGPFAFDNSYARLPERFWLRAEMISDLGPAELGKRYLKTKDDRRLLGRSLGHVRMVHARAEKCS